MSFASHFTSAFKPPFGSDKQFSSRKRKRGSVNSDQESNDSQVDACLSYNKPGPSVSESAIPGLSSIATAATVRRELAVQYQTAGQLSADGLPGTNFPHIPTPRTAISPMVGYRLTVKDELATLNPPLTRIIPPVSKHSNASETAGTTGLREKHLDNIIAILYRCILEGDFLRAGRAWGMLLRAEKSGRGMDIRQSDRWGLGAEILLKRASGGEGKASGSAQDSAQDQPIDDPEQWFSGEGFENAKDYYERLILQYPFRKAFPTATCALDFYPAMLGLWLCVAQDQHISAMTAVDRTARDLADSSTGTHKNGSPSPSSGSANREQVAEIRTYTLQRGNEIASRLDELLVSPPYSDDSRLWRLRGMVALWIADLWIVGLPSTADPESSGGGSSSTSEPISRRASGWHPQAISEHERCWANRQIATLKAEQAFQIVTEKG